MSPWHLVMLPSLSAAVALIELDGVHVGQWMISRPIVLGPVLGALCGVPWMGIAGGVLIELFCVDVLPVGAALPLNGTVAIASFVLLGAGPDAIPAPLAFPAALAMGSSFRRVENWVRSRRARVGRSAEEVLDDGKPLKFWRVLSKGLLLHAAATTLFLYAGVAGLGPLLDWGWEAAPEPVRRGLDLAFMNAPWLALAALIYSLRPRG